MLRAFEDITEEQRYIHSLSLKHFSEWVKWDNVLATDPQWTRWILFRFNLAATGGCLADSECAQVLAKSHRCKLQSVRSQELYIATYPVWLSDCTEARLADLAT